MDSIDHIRPAQRTSSTNSSSTTATTTTSELFICFTSRLSSSSSMKISSKSILSPGRARDSSQISLSTSLSRRLRTNGSLKGGQASPMFPSTNAKKRGCASFENPEPSSPKVTCIGQVRVKTKKHGNKMRARSKSRRGEVSFRKTEQINTSNTINTSNGCNNNNTHGGHSISNANGNSHLHYNQFQQPPPQECLSEAPRNQRWVHFPVTICEALRTFGAEFNCFLPCRSSCMARGHKEDKSTVGSDYRSGSNHGGNGGNGNNTSSSCGAVFARWLVAEKIELVMGKEDEDEEVDLPRRSQRRHVFEDIVIEDDVNNGKFGGENEILKRDEVEEEKGRVSACVPPKNALLLMRCRSDPVKMAALANRFWECPVPQEEEEEENGVVKEVCGVEEVKNVVGKEIRGLEEEENGGVENQNEGKEEEEEEDDDGEERLDSCQVVEEKNRISVAKVEMREEKKELKAEDSDSNPDLNNTENVDDKTIAEINGGEDAGLGNEDELDEKLVELEGETEQIDSVSEVIADPKMGEEEMEGLLPANEDEIETIEDDENDDVFNEVEEKRWSVYSSSAEQESEVQDQNQDLLIAAELADDEETEKKTSEKEGGQESSENDERSGFDDPEMSGEGESGPVSKERESQKDQNLLPDCLLLMMCEPKLSMEVSKETWVCSTDFIRWQVPNKKPLPPPPPPPLPEQLVVKKTDDGDESKRRISIDSNAGGPARHQLLQPPRSSCSFPLAPPMFPAHKLTPSMNTMIEQKLVGGKPSSYEPFMLTRCKSEPMRTAASKLAPDACFWKNRKLEPHRPTTCGVGAAGVGF